MSSGATRPSPYSSAGSSAGGDSRGPTGRSPYAGTGYDGLFNPLSPISGPILLRPPPERAAEGSATGDGAAPAEPVRGGLLGRLRGDHLVRGSLFLILSSGLQAVLGFAFWTLTARLYPAAEVGSATSMISGSTLAAYLALLGLNSTFIARLAGESQRDRVITAGLVAVAATGALAGTVYAVVAPVFAPALGGLHRPALLVGFALMTAVGALNLLTDAVFIASRKAGYNAVIDGLLGGAVKVIAVLALAGGGAFALFLAATSGFAAAAAASVVVAVVALRYRPGLRGGFGRLRSMLALSGANYLANSVNLVPSLALPLIVLRGLGPETAAYYYVAFQVATLLHAAVWAVEQSFLAEGAHLDDWRPLLRRSAKVAAVVALPGSLVLSLAAPLLLPVFGHGYSSAGTGALILMAVAAVPIAAMSWLQTVLRLGNRLGAIVLVNVVYAVAVSGLAVGLLPYGLAGVAAAWPLGATAAALTAVPSVVGAIRERGPQAPRLLIVSAYAPPHVGGVEVVVAQQARTLAATGFTVTVVTSRTGRGSRREELDGWTVVRVPAWNGTEHRLGVPFPVWSPTGLWTLVREVLRADVVHVHDVLYVSSVLGTLVARLLRRPVFLTQHVAVVEHDRAVVGLAQRAVYGTAGRLLWWAAREVTCYNPIVRDFLLASGVPPGKVALTYNGVDTGVFRPADRVEEVGRARARFGLAPHQPVVLFVGRLVPKKGFDTLVAAAHPGYQLALAGSGRIPDHVPPGVRFLGPVDRADLPELYRAADLFAFPAVGEMLTLVMQEAMASGLPVVTTAEPAYAAYGFDPDGLTLVEPRPDVLRQAILSIVGDDRRRHAMGAYSRELAVERFDWARNAERLADGYRAVLRQRGQARQVRHELMRAPRPSWRDPRLLALVPLVLIGASVATPQGRHQWMLSLTRQPDRTTTLAFSDPATLPSAVTAQGTLPLRFTIANAEGREVRYRYTVRRVQGATVEVLSTGSRQVADRATAAVATVVRPSCAAACRIEIVLEGRVQHLALRLAGPTAGTGAGTAAATGGGTRG